jgi:hypothetical protein
MLAARHLHDSVSVAVKAAMKTKFAVRVALVALTVLLTARAASGQGCYESSIVSPTPFMGNNGEIFRLADGSIWEVKYEYEYLYEYGPRVTICPARGRLIIRNKTLNVEQLKAPSPATPSRTPARPASPGLVPQLEPRIDDDFSFYDSQGRAAAYFETSGELVIYLWSGEPVAYLDGDSIFGFNGKHLGWYRDGLIYDHDGGILVAPASAFRDAPGPAPPRSLKGLKPLKGLKELKPLKPLFGRFWSKLPARVLFLSGVD